MHTVEQTTKILMLLGAVGLALGGVTGLCLLARSAYRLTKRVERIFDVVEHELTPDGGASMKDHVKATHDRFKALDGRVTLLEGIEIERGGRRHTDPEVVHPPTQIPIITDGPGIITTPPPHASPDA